MKNLLLIISLLGMAPLAVADPFDNILGIHDVLKKECAASDTWCDNITSVGIISGPGAYHIKENAFNGDVFTVALTVTGIAESRRGWNRTVNNTSDSVTNVAYQSWVKDNVSGSTIDTVDETRTFSVSDDRTTITYTYVNVHKTGYPNPVTTKVERILTLKREAR